jgi:hypothetical protein
MLREDLSGREIVEDAVGNREYPGHGAGPVVRGRIGDRGAQAAAIVDGRRRDRHGVGVAEIEVGEGDGSGDAEDGVARRALRLLGHAPGRDRGDDGRTVIGAENGDRNRGQLRVAVGIGDAIAERVGGGLAGGQRLQCGARRVDEQRARLRGVRQVEADGDRALGGLAGDRDRFDQIGDAVVREHVQRGARAVFPGRDGVVAQHHRLVARIHGHAVDDDLEILEPGDAEVEGGEAEVAAVRLPVAMGIVGDEAQEIGDVALHGGVQPLRAGEHEPEPVDAGAAVVAVGRSRILGSAVDGEVVAALAADLVGPGIAVERVVARSAGQPVVAGAAEQDVVVRAALQAVVAQPAEQEVVAGLAAQAVLTGASVDEVCCPSPLDTVVAVRSDFTGHCIPPRGAASRIDR